MRSLFAPPPDCEPARAASPRDDLLPDRFAAAAAAGHTIALVMAKDPDAAAVYYFRDGARALATYERLARLSSRPLVAFVSPEGVVLGGANLDASGLGRSGVGWFAAGLRGDASPLREDPARDADAEEGARSPTSTVRALGRAVC